MPRNTWTSLQRSLELPRPPPAQGQVAHFDRSQKQVVKEVGVNMDDGDKSVSIAVNGKQGKQVQSSGHHGAVSREMLVMCNVHTMKIIRGCSKENVLGHDKAGCMQACVTR
jgi:hypothetical protein